MYRPVQWSLQPLGRQYACTPVKPRKRELPNESYAVYERAIPEPEPPASTPTKVNPAKLLEPPVEPTENPPPAPPSPVAKKPTLSSAKVRLPFMNNATILRIRQRLNLAMGRDKNKDLDMPPMEAGKVISSGPGNTGAKPKNGPRGTLALKGVGSKNYKEALRARYPPKTENELDRMRVECGDRYEAWILMYRRAAKPSGEGDEDRAKLEHLNQCFANLFLELVAERPSVPGLYGQRFDEIGRFSALLDLCNQRFSK